MFLYAALCCFGLLVGVGFKFCMRLTISYLFRAFWHRNQNQALIVLLVILLVTGKFGFWELLAIDVLNKLEMSAQMLFIVPFYYRMRIL